MINNVIFDIGGVIIDYKKETYLDYFNFNPEVREILMTKVMFSKDWSKLAVGKITHQEFVKNAKENFPKLSKEIDLMTDNHNYKFMMPPITATIELIKNLKKQGRKIFIISDTEENTIEYFTREIKNFESLFDDVIYSCRVGMVKKNGDIFDYAIERFLIKPEETLFVDDVERNLVQAQARNIKTIQFISPEETIPKIKAILKQTP